jgi:hypothetical protein
MKITVDSGEADFLWKCPLWHRVQRFSGYFDFGALHEDSGITEAVVLAAVIEVKM